MFKANDRPRDDYAMRHLVQKLVAQVGRAFLDFGHAPSGFGAIAAALLGARETSLRPAQFPLPSPVVAGSAHLLAVGADQKVGRLEDHIVTDRLVFAGRHFRRRHLKLHHHSYEPVAYGGALEGGTPGREFDRLRLANPDASDRRHINASVLNPNPLRDTKRLSRRSLFFELGKPSPALEEINIGAPEIGQRLLQHLGVEVVE